MQLELLSAEPEALLLELSNREPAPLGRKNKYPQAGFDYSRYQNDPKPNVLVFGDYKHPSTGNNLLCGINLNYLSHRQLLQLRKVAKRLFSRSTTKSRWRYLDSVLPDIAKHAYRTYDEKYIRAIHADEFLGTTPKPTAEPKPLPEPETKDIKVDAKKMEIHPEPEKGDDAVDTARSLWQLKRRLYNPETGKREKPERTKVKGSAKAKREKINRYRSQRRELKDLEQKVNRELAAEVEPEDLEQEPELEPVPAEFEPVESVSKPYYSSDLGFVWKNPTQYKAYHIPENFCRIKHLCPGKILAVKNLVTGQMLVDAVEDHVYILSAAGWGYDHTVLLEYDNGDIVMRSDDGVVLEDVDIDVLRLLKE